MMAVSFVPTPTAVIRAHSASKTRVNALVLGIYIPELVVMGPRFRGDDSLLTLGHPEEP